MSSTEFDLDFEKTHSAEKSNKCNQCDFISSQASNLRTHFKIHSGEKSNKCDLSYKLIYLISVTLHALIEVLYGDISKHTVEKN